MYTYKTVYMYNTASLPFREPVLLDVPTLFLYSTVLR